jgi:hypothetical protein
MMRVMLLLLTGTTTLPLVEGWIPDTRSQSNNQQKIARAKYHIRQSAKAKSVSGELWEEAKERRSRRPRITSTTTSSSLLSPSYYPAADGLSKFHQSILRRTRTARQAVLTGRDALVLSVRDSPTLHWLAVATRRRTDGSRPSTAQLYVNNTVLDKSTASLERRWWLHEEEEDEQHGGWHAPDGVTPRTDVNGATAGAHEGESHYYSLEWVAEIHMERPGYVHILPASCVAASLVADEPPRRSWQDVAADRLVRAGSSSSDGCSRDEPQDMLVCTGFSLAGRKGGRLASLDTVSGRLGRVNDRTRSHLVWPNEVTTVPVDLVRPPLNMSQGSGAATPRRTMHNYRDALLVADGFLVPGKDRGGLYVVQQAGDPTKEWTVRLTANDSSQPWFYHKSTWVDLTGDGRLSILTARCRVSTKFGGVGSVEGSVTTGVQKKGQLVWLEAPQPHAWDPKTNTPLEADGTVFDPLAARHLPWQEHVLADGPDVMFCVADLDPTDDTVEVLASQFFHQSVRLLSIQRGLQPRVVLEREIDSQCGAAFASVLASLDATPSTSSISAQGPLVIDTGSTVPSLRCGDSFSHLLVTSHECSYAPAEASAEEGEDATAHRPHLSTDRSTIKGGSVFAYRVPTGRPDAWKTEPWLRSTVATGFQVNSQLGNMINPGAPGFCYSFPARQGDSGRPLLAVAGDCAESAYVFRPVDTHDPMDPDPSTCYKLMVEVACQATVGSIGVGYDDFLATDQESGYAKLYIPCYEKDKIYVFALGSGEDDQDGW